MIYRSQPGILPVQEGAMLSGDPVAGADDPLGSDPSQTDDDPGPEQDRLMLQIKNAGLLLLRQRVTVSRRMAFYQIRQVNILPFHPG